MLDEIAALLNLDKQAATCQKNINTDSKDLPPCSQQLLSSSDDHIVWFILKTIIYWHIFKAFSLILTLHILSQISRLDSPMGFKMTLLYPGALWGKYAPKNHPWMTVLILLLVRNFILLRRKQPLYIFINFHFTQHQVTITIAVLYAYGFSSSITSPSTLESLSANRSLIAYLWVNRC